MQVPQNSFDIQIWVGNAKQKYSYTIVKVYLLLEFDGRGHWNLNLITPQVGSLSLVDSVLDKRELHSLQIWHNLVVLRTSLTEKGKYRERIEANIFIIPRWHNELC